MTADELLALLEKFPWDEWNKRLEPGLRQVYRNVVNVSGTDAAAAAGATWKPNDPFVSKFATRYVGARIVQLDDTTRAEVAEMVRRALDEQAADVQDLAAAIGDAVREKFDGYEQYRALRIARTETAIAYNHGAVLGFAQGGVEQVEVLDGTDDDVCREANGKTWTLREAIESPLGHPNCQRAMIPIIKDDVDAETSRVALERMAREFDDALILGCAARSEVIAAAADPHGRDFDCDESDE